MEHCKAYFLGLIITLAFALASITPALAATNSYGNCPYGSGPYQNCTSSTPTKSTTPSESAPTTPTPTTVTPTIPDTDTTLPTPGRHLVVNYGWFIFGLIFLILALILFWWLIARRRRGDKDKQNWRLDSRSHSYDATT